jgi:hypothetical protein
MIELSIILLSVLVARWYLTMPIGGASHHEPNLNPAVDEWNAREMVEKESESFYE